MLAAYLGERDREEAWQAYTAQMLWYLNRATYERVGKKFEHPTWLDMVRGEPKDDRSGPEVIEDLKKMLRERKKKREGGN